MSTVLIFSIVIITLALVFYSVGVLGEARRKHLEWRDVVFFSLGLVSDAAGTALMSRMASSGERHLAPWASNLMAISGTLAIVLMALHLLFAVFVLMKKPEMRSTFHKWSLIIWGVWLFSYFVGPLGLMIG